MPFMFHQRLTQRFRADKEIDIVHELGQKVLEREGMLNLASDICGELDRHVCNLDGSCSLADNFSLLALAQGAKIYKYCRPQMTQENIIMIKGGRYVLHLLLRSVKARS